MEGERNPCRSKIIGTGRAVPDGVLTNADLEKKVDTSDQWIRDRTGIKERRIAPPGMRTSELCEMAAKKALAAAGITPDDLDLIIVATATPDMPFPSTACFLQERLKTRGQAAFDLTAACSGFVYALTTADCFIKSGAAKRVLVVGAELMSRIIDWEDRSTCVLFGDGAGAVVLGPSDDENKGILASHLAADGAFSSILNLPGGGTANPTTEKTVGAGLHYLKMQGNEVFKLAVRALGESAKAALDQAKISAEELDLFIPHQANSRIIGAVAKRLGVSSERVYVNVDRYGNTSAASIPIALDELVRSGQITPGKLILLDAFGGGVAYGAVVIRW